MAARACVRAGVLGYGVLGRNGGWCAIEGNGGEQRQYVANSAALDGAVRLGTLPHTYAA
jgi:hypothetical protein